MFDSCLSLSVFCYYQGFIFNKYQRALLRIQSKIFDVILLLVQDAISDLVDGEMRCLYSDGRTYFWEWTHVFLSFGIILLLEPHCFELTLKNPSIPAWLKFCCKSFYIILIETCWVMQKTFSLFTLRFSWPFTSQKVTCVLPHNRLFFSYTLLSWASRMKVMMYFHRR